MTRDASATIAGPANTSGSWRPAGGAGPASGANPYVVLGLVAMSGIAVFVFGVLVMVFIQDEAERKLDEPRPRLDVPVVVASRGYDEVKSQVPPVEKAPSAPEKSKASVVPGSRPEPDPAPARPAPAAKDPQEIVGALKNATVLLRKQVGGKPLSSGTGFVIEVQKDTVLLVTNRHVAILEKSEVPSNPGSPDAKVELEAIFRCGQGSKLEQSLPATVIATDFSDDIHTDLAFLQVKGVREPPTPINIPEKFEITEGLRYLGAGFPLEGTVNDSVAKTNPLVLVEGGQVAALARDDSGRLSLLKIDGSLPAGSRGGPILDEKSGRLIGVAVAKHGSTVPISLAIPVDELRRALKGRVGSVELVLQKSDKSTAEIQVKAQVVDPKQLMKEIAVHIVPAVPTPSLSPLPDGSWPPVTKSKESTLTHDVKSSVASGGLKVALKGEGPDSRRVLVQTGFKDAKGKLVFDMPQEVTLPEKAGRILPSGYLDRILRSARRDGVHLLGPLLENSKDCQLIKDEQSLTIRIDMPAKLFTLAPELANSRNVPLHNAPITLAEVEGDFAAFVEVGGEIDPGTTPPKDPKDPRNKRLPFCVQSQGLIVYQDAENFLRLERTETVFPRASTTVHGLMVEFVLKGRHAITPVYREISEPFTVLMLVKRKGKVRCLFSPDQGRSIVPFQDFDLELPPKVHIGLSASNISTKPFSAVFANFAILSDEAKIDRTFSE